jgi:hypothetical protein
MSQSSQNDSVPLMRKLLTVDNALIKAERTDLQFQIGSRFLLKVLSGNFTFDLRVSRSCNSYENTDPERLTILADYSN